MNPADAPEQNKREWEAVPDSCHGEDKSGQMMMKGQRALRTVVRVSTIVWTVIASVALGVFLGQLVDKRLQTQPVFIVLLSILGVVAAIRFLFNLSGKL